VPERKRVAIGLIAHETNSFSPIQTPLEAFSEEPPGIVTGEDVIAQSKGGLFSLGAFVEIGEREGWELVGTVMAGATPSADVEPEAHDELKRLLIEPIRASLPVDGVLLFLHGAMLSKNAPDAEGDFCQAVREVVGPDVPIIVAMDLHGNITAEFCTAVNGVIAYETNPHIDDYECGIDAAELMAAVLDGRTPMPSVFISKPPMLPATINMRTTEGPMRTLFEHARRWEEDPVILDVSIFGGFAFADFPDAGTAVVVTATDPTRGTACAREIGQLAWELRDQFLKEIPDVNMAVDQALRLVAEGGEGPVILADVSDNPGGGGPGDTTEILHELVRRGAKGAVACVWDPETVRQALSVGVGNSGRFRIAGKAAPDQYGPPVEVEGRVTMLSDGVFVGHGPVVREATVHCGPSAVIDVNGLKLVVVSIRHAANDRGYFTMAGIQPEHEPLLVIKSRGHFRADFEPIAQTIIEVDAPGPANPNLDRFTFQHVRRPIWPLDRHTTWDSR
jgi:microcystin degradation protein MlrC